MSSSGGKKYTPPPSKPSASNVRQGGRFASASDNRSNKANTARLQGEETFEVTDSSGNRVQYNTQEYQRYQQQQAQQKQEAERRAVIQPKPERKTTSKSFEVTLNEKLGIADRTTKAQAITLSERVGIGDKTTKGRSVSLRERISIVDSPPTTVSIKPATVKVQKQRSNVSMFASGGIVVKPIVDEVRKFSESLRKSTGISLKGQMQKIVKEESKPPKDPDRILKPLESPSDLIQTVQRPVLNIRKYFAAVPEASRRIITTGDYLAGEKYFEENIAPTMRKTASSRLFSGDLKELFNPKRGSENILSAATEIGLYAFTGGRLGRTGKIPKRPAVEDRPSNAGVYRTTPRNVFRMDKAQPQAFRTTEINLGTGLGKFPGESQSGLTLGKTRPGKPPSSFRTTKFELGKGIGRLPTSPMITKEGLLLEQIVKPKFERKATYVKLGSGEGKLISTKPQTFKTTTLKLGEGEAKIMNMFKDQTKKPSAQQKKKIQTGLTGEYFVQEEVIRYPPTATRSEVGISDVLQTQKSVRQKQQPLIISQIVNPKQDYKQGFVFSDIVTTKLSQKQQQGLPIPILFKQSSKPASRQKQYQEPQFASAQKSEFALIEQIPLSPTFARTTPRPPIEPQFKRGGFFPYFPGISLGSFGFGDKNSLKRSFATYGISSDINIKTLPTYSRYSTDKGIFQSQLKEDKKIQDLFYGKPRRKSKTKRKTTKSKSKKKK